MSCTKPNCDCLEKEMKRIGGDVKYGYPCLHDDSNLDAVKTKLPPSDNTSMEEGKEEKWVAAGTGWNERIDYNRGWDECHAILNPLIEEGKTEVGNLNQRIKILQSHCEIHTRTIQTLQQRIRELEPQSQPMDKGGEGKEFTKEDLWQCWIICTPGAKISMLPIYREEFEAWLKIGLPRALNHKLTDPETQPEKPYNVRKEIDWHNANFKVVDELNEIIRQRNAEITSLKSQLSDKGQGIERGLIVNILKELDKLEESEGLPLLLLNLSIKAKAALESHPEPEVKQGIE